MTSLVNITYATTTGASSDLALRLSYRLKRKGYATRVRSFETADLPWNDDATKGSSVHVFMISTTGEGQEPSAMTEAWNRLCKKRTTLCDTCYYTIYGLGDSSYEK